MVKTNTSHRHILSRITSQFILLFCSRIGLDKPTVRAKGINHPKHAVKPACACLTRESATSEEDTLLHAGHRHSETRCKEGTGRAICRYKTSFSSIRRHGGRLNLEGKKE